MSSSETNGTQSGTQSASASRQSAKEGIASKVADFMAKRTDELAEAHKTIAAQNPLSPDEQLSLLRDQEFIPIPYRVTDDVLPHVTDPRVINQAIRSAELADDAEWSMKWKQWLFELHRRAENEAINLADIERVNLVAEGAREHMKKKKLGLTGLVGEEEQARRQKEIDRILGVESTSGGGFESVEALEEAIAAAEAHIADPERRLSKYDEWTVRNDLDQMLIKRERIEGIQNAPRIDESASHGQLVSEAKKSISDKVAALWAG